MNSQRSIAVIGGTGAEGSGLALRWAHAGHKVSIGSRDPAKALAIADELNGILEKRVIEAGDSRSVAAASDVVVLTVPYAAQLTTAEQLATVLSNKILIDVTVPLVPRKEDTMSPFVSPLCPNSGQNAINDTEMHLSAS